VPFKSEKQRRYLYKNKPALAKKWTKKYKKKKKKKEK
jgi:ribosomal protein L24E|tara:strand:+ start:1091 stop:1201 length:111 start_codon:yes stop_codon:yes gene_type:complete